MGKCFFRSFQLSVSPNVYMPREDSFLLAENAEIKKGADALDLGCGTGIQGINAAMLGAKKVLCTDASDEALECAKLNAEKLGLERRISFRKSDLFWEIPEKFDCIIFNPPYVASDEIEQADVDGGKQGRKVLDKFLREFPKHLKKGGKCFFLQSSLNGESRTAGMLKQCGLRCEVVARQRLFFEEIMVFKAAVQE